MKIEVKVELDTDKESDKVLLQKRIELLEEYRDEE